MTKLRSTAKAVPTVADNPLHTQQVGRGIAVAAGVIAIGNVLSSVLGQVRNSTIAGLFGGSVESSAYYVASRVPNTLYDLLVGGLVSAALVPVFSELAERDERELNHVASTVFTTIIGVIGLAIVGVWLFAPQLGALITSSQADGPLIRPIAVTLIRWMAPALLLMALTGLLTGLEQARRRFLLPALAISMFNLGMIVCAYLLHTRLSVRSLAVGMVVGAGAQVTLLAWGLRGLGLRLSLDLHHPAVRRIVRLYAPVVVGIGFSVVGTTWDSNLATRVAANTASIMAYATTLIQFGMGVITSAISLAALPTLSRQGVDPNDLTAYRRTLAWSLKSVLLLILPAAVGLAVLARPIVMVLFEHGKFTPADTQLTTLALIVYVPSMIAAAVDQPLIFAWYARKNTLLPNLVQGVAIAAYLVTALSLVRVWGIYGLIVGNVVQWTVHALVMLVLTERRIGIMRGQRLGEAVAKGMLASVGMGVALWAGLAVAGSATTPGQALVQLVIGGVGGVGVYAAIALGLRIEAFGLLVAGLRGRLARGDNKRM